MREIARLGAGMGIVGGGPPSQGFADRIGADGYAANAGSAVKLVRRLVNDVGLADVRETAYA